MGLYVSSQLSTIILLVQDILIFTLKQHSPVEQEEKKELNCVGSELALVCLPSFIQQPTHLCLSFLYPELMSALRTVHFLYLCLGPFFLIPSGGLLDFIIQVSTQMHTSLEGAPIPHSNPNHSLSQAFSKGNPRPAVSASQGAC